MHDLKEGEALFGLPEIPCWCERGIEPRTGTALDGERVLAIFHGPRPCKCGRPYGIAYDLDAIRNADRDPNEILLHELVHAWQLFRDPDQAVERARDELARFGYWDAPFEYEARELARQLNELGVTVWRDDAED